MPKPIPTQQELAELLDYQAETGEFTWKVRPAAMFPCEANSKTWNAQFAGRPAFTTKNGNGYLCGYIDHQKLYAHRVAWKYMYGDEPAQIDHQNGNRADNRILNLSAANARSNNRNMSQRSNNTSGVTGVSWDALVDKWHAYITIDGKTVNLGRFVDYGEAVAARKAGEVVHNFHPNHGRKAN